MLSSVSFRFLFTLILALVCLVATAPSSVRAQSNCAQYPAHNRSATLRLAIVVHGPPFANPLSEEGELLPTNPYLLPPGSWRDPITNKTGGPWFFNPTLDEPMFQAQILYQELMNASGGILLRDGTKMPVELVYFNIGPASGAAGNVTLYDLRAKNLGKQLADEHGIYGRFPFILTPAFTPGAAKLKIQLRFMEACETSQTCITIGAVSGEPNQYICPDTSLPANADCLARGRPTGSRRFRFGVSNFGDPSYDLRGHLSLFRQQGIRTVALLMDSQGTTSAIYAQTQRLATQVGIKVVYKVKIPSSPTGTLADLGMSPDSVAADLIATNPEGMLVVTSVGGITAKEVAAVLTRVNASGWWPSALAFGGGVDNNLLGAGLMTANDLAYTNGFNPWSPLFQDASYHAVNVPQVNFELYSSTDTEDSPQVFARMMADRWGPPADPVATYIFAACYTGALHIAQKLVETTMNDDAPLMVAAQPGLSYPNVWGPITFDPYGRVAVREQAVYQNLPLAGTSNKLARVMNYPPNIGQAVIFPIPSFADRIYSPEYISDPLETIVLVITAVAIAFVLGWIGFVLVHWKAPAIRAATPLFCLLILVGCLSLLVSNFGVLTQSTDSLCAMQYWLLTIGFSLTFAPLFIRTYRIWRIFNVQRLTVQSLPTSLLLMWLGVVIGADVIINAIMTGTGANEVELHTPDPFRPSLNYKQCHTGKEAPFLIAHIAIKGLLTLFGMVLSWKVRNVESRFNESVHIVVVIYNLALVCIFAIPIVITEVGGRLTAMAVQSFAVIFVSVATTAVLFVPKYLGLNLTRNYANTAVDQTRTLDSEDPQTPAPPMKSNEGQPAESGETKLKHRTNTTVSNTTPSPHVVIHTDRTMTPLRSSPTGTPLAQTLTTSPSPLRNSPRRIPSPSNNTQADSAVSAPALALAAAQSDIHTTSEVLPLNSPV
jgi:hypothetical protein